MKKPAGVILTSIVLGLFAGLQLLFAVIAGFAGIMARNLPEGTVPTATYPAGTVAPPPGLILGIMIAYSVFLVLLAAWAIVTLVGLVRLRNWARYSVLVIGACLAGFGVLAIFGTLVAMTVMNTMPMPPNTPPHMMQIVLGVNAVLFAGIAAVGIWWLVYFNLKTTKAFFVPGYALADGVLLLDESAAGWLHLVPTPVIVVGCLFVVGGVCSLGGLLFSYPVFVAGFVLSPIWGHLLYFMFAMFGIWVGGGLLRLRNEARLATYGFMALGAVNAVVFLTPWCRARFAIYNAQLYERMHLPTSPLTASLMSGPLLMYSVVLWVALYGVLVWILHRYRASFQPQP